MFKINMETAEQIYGGWQVQIYFEIDGERYRVVGFDQEFSFAKMNARAAMNAIISQ